MKRRSFLKRSAIVTVPLMINGHSVGALASSLFSPPPFYDRSDKILVLIQMDGGNDGLNTLIPLDQYTNLQKVRPNIILPENYILTLSGSNLGLHPGMEGMHQMYEEGLLKIIQNTGYPSPNRSHFRSTDIWTSASPADQNWTTGWIGRYLDSLYPGYPQGFPDAVHPDPFAITIASNVSETCQGILANYSMAITNPDNLSELTEGNADEVPDNPYGFELKFLRTAIAQTNAYGEVVSAAATNGNNLSTMYAEDNGLAQQLKIIARLISGGLSTSIYVVRMGGFDTHANQVDTGDALTGKHAELLKTLSDAIRAFQDDLQLLGLDQRVLGMTFTEFGRQIQSNESFGTDHGEAGPMFLFGACVDATVLGDNPVIPENPGKQEALAYQIDFRNVYGSIMSHWFGMEEQLVNELIFPDFVPLDLIDTCGTSGSNFLKKTVFSAYVFPNPFQEKAFLTIESETGGTLTLDIYNQLGQFNGRLLHTNATPGRHDFAFSNHLLSPGTYFGKISLGNQIQTIKLIRQ